MTGQRQIEEISRRIEDIYRRWAEGEDVSPALVFRTEGFIEAVCDGGAVSKDEVLALMNTLHQQQFNRALAAAAEGPIRIHGAMRRAPVYPSTR